MDTNLTGMREVTDDELHAVDGGSLSMAQLFDMISAVMESYSKSADAALQQIGRG